MARASERGLPEPWLRGPLPDVHPLVMPVFFSFAQVREDLSTYLEGLTDEQLWQTVGKSSLGFHLKHMAGSVDRLSAYLAGESLSADQLGYLAEEHQPTGSTADWIAQIDRSLSACERLLRQIDPNELFAPRMVGRARLPTSVLGLLVHLAEHTQRHLGQAITLSEILRHADVSAR